MTNLIEHSLVFLALLAPAPIAVTRASPPDPTIRSANPRVPPMLPSTRPPLRVVRSTIGPQPMCCSRAAPLNPPKPKAP